MGRRKEFVAEGGRPGAGWRKRGRNGKDLVIPVPAGTAVFTKSRSGDQVLLADLIIPGQQVLAARGGKGGLGNARFVTPVNQAPETATKGELGERQEILLEVKLITDVCLVGLANAGKSTLLSAISRARPEIADYPFTTREPVLGVVGGQVRDFIFAEIPALVKGAHLGKGLGNEFLRHVERTKLVIYLLDGSSPTVREDLNTLENEMALYKGLSSKRKVVAVNKIDLPEVAARLPEIKRSLAGLGLPVFYISARTGEGVLELTRKATAIVEEIGCCEDMVAELPTAIFRPKPRQ